MHILRLRLDRRQPWVICTVGAPHPLAPLDSVVADGVLIDSATTSTCPWKGTASYYSVVVDGQTNEDAAWYYPTPKDAAKEIADRIAFWKGVVVAP